MDKKMTYVQAVDFALSVVEMADHIAGDEFTKDELVEKLTALKATLVKRAQKSDKPTKKQLALAEDVGRMVGEFTEDCEGKTVSELIAIMPTLAGQSVSGATARLTKLVDAHILRREKVKGKSCYFRCEVEGV